MGASGPLPSHERRRLLDPLRQVVDLFGRVVEVEAGPGSGGHAQPAHEGLGAIVLPRPQGTFQVLTAAEIECYP